jgi:hypothetical protein
LGMTASTRSFSPMAAYQPISSNQATSRARSQTC